MERKKALITGASRGIGYAIAREFAASGYDLFLTCHKNIEQLTEQGRKLEQEYGISCFCCMAAADSEDDIEALFKNIKRLDVLVNNAGISYIGMLADMSYMQWKQVIETNLNSCFLTCKYAIPGMVHQKCGKIVNISSVWGNVGASMEVAYSASKGGMNSFTKALAKELGPSNIQVNAVSCGVIDTDMNRCFDETEMSALIEEIPADRIGKTEEVAHLVMQICTGNEYLTGQIITLDGGWI